MSNQCKHGQLARQCEICELEDQVQDLQRKINYPWNRYWFPIGTAPRDDSDVLIATRSYVGGVIMAAWDEQAQAHRDMYGDTFPDATHWMPLPEPPMERTND